MAVFMLQWQELNSCDKLHKAKNIYLTHYRKSLMASQLNARGIKRTPILTSPMVSQHR